MAHIIDITMQINGVEYPATIEFKYSPVKKSTITPLTGITSDDMKWFFSGDDIPDDIPDEFDLKILEIKSGFLKYDVSFLIHGAEEDIINQLKNMELD